MGGRNQEATGGGFVFCLVLVISQLGVLHELLNTITFLAVLGSAYVVL